MHIYRAVIARKDVVKKRMFLKTTAMESAIFCVKWRRGVITRLITVKEVTNTLFFYIFSGYGVKVRPRPRDPGPRDPGTQDPGPPSKFKSGTLGPH